MLIVRLRGGRLRARLCLRRNHRTPYSSHEEEAPDSYQQPTYIQELFEQRPLKLHHRSLRNFPFSPEETMNTPGTALIGYAVLRANFNHQAASYLDNFTPFVMTAIAVSRNNYVDKDEISETVLKTFGINIPSLAVPKMIRRMRKNGLAESNSSGAVSLTLEGKKQIPDLSTEVELYRSRQNELVQHFAQYIEREYPQHLDLTTRDLTTQLAEFFDRHSVSLVKAGIDSSSPSSEYGDGFEYAISSFINYLYKNGSS